MKATHPIDLYILDKLFQLSTTAVDCDRQEELSGKTVVVFGGSQGIGSDIVEAAKILGANVFSFSRKTTNTYVEKNEDVSKALRETYQKTGRIDYVVNTAGLLHIQSLSDMNNETVVNAIEVNYIAPIIVAKASFPYLKKTKGQLLLFTSSSYTRGRAEYSVYSSSKAAVVNLTQALADEWVKDDIRINCINPERTATPMRLKAFGKEDPRSLLCSADVARASINTLLSDITGQVIDVRRKH
jgi:2-C-methyl-D-erythritol 4-phosphate cytidylyltransferase